MQVCTPFLIFISAALANFVKNEVRTSHGLLQKRSIPVVGCQSPTNRSSPQQNVHDNPPRVVEGKQDLPGVCTNDEAQDVFLEISEINFQCYSSFTSKAHERRELELKVASM